MSRPNRRRIATVLLAPIAALSGWALIRLAGVDPVASGGVGTVGASDVFVAALFAALAASLVVRLLERHTRRPRARWPVVASTALGLSLVGPSWLADGAGAVALIGLHVVTAVVVILGFAPTIACRGATAPA